MFFKGEVGDKIFLEGGVPAYSSNRQFTLKTMRNWRFCMFSSAIFNKLEGGKNRSVQKYF
jgi:hypothetical protein